jgi:RNA polymerase sigma factor (sigma-70 family)
MFDRDKWTRRLPARTNWPEVDLGDQHMGPGVTSSSGRSLQTLFGLGVTAAMSDQQLLEQFIAGRGSEREDAFAALVDRHRTMVWRVCRRILADPNDAEDAFQVTFLVLARKARSIARRSLMAQWLYGVAVRSSKEVKTREARRRTMEARYRDLPRHHGSGIAEVEPLLAVLDSEINRLPEIFRSPIVLCDVEGRSHQEAARLLGVPIGTIASRLSRARDRLRRGLERHGCSASPAAIAAALARDARMASHALVARTIHLADCIVSGGSAAAAIPASLIALVRDVTRSMRFAILLTRTSILSLGLILCAGGVSVLGVVNGFLEFHPKLAASQPRGQGTSATSKTSQAASAPSAHDLAVARLKRCVSSAEANYAALSRATYEFDFRQEVAQLDDKGEPLTISVLNYHGKVYWRDGSVRYDVEGPPLAPQLDENGQLLQKKSFSVIRTNELVATSDLFPQLPRNKEGIHREKPPATTRAWLDRHPFLLSQIDPWVFYAKNVRIDVPNLRTLGEKPNAIRSADGRDTIVMRLRRGDIEDAQTELIFDKKADCLPTSARFGIMREDRWIPWAEDSCEWKKTGGVWFPAHQVEIGYVGEVRKPVKFFDLTIRNLRVNADAVVPDSVFDPQTLLPGTGHGQSGKRK